MARRSTSAQPAQENSRWSQAWGDFLLDPKKGGVTRANYRVYAKKIDAFRVENAIDDPDLFTDALERKFLDQFHNETTKWTYQKVLRSFINWCFLNGWRSYLPKDGRIKLQEPDVTKILTYDQMRQMQTVANDRDRMILAFVFETAARAGEVRNAKLADYHKSDRTFVIKQSKVKKDREAPLSEDFARDLNGYLLKIRPHQKGIPKGAKDERRTTSQPWLFLTNTVIDGDYQQLSRSGMASIFRRIRLQLNWEPGSASPQLLRRGRATELVRANRDTAQVKRVIGWHDDRSMKPYIAHSTAEDKAFVDEVAKSRR